MTATPWVQPVADVVRDHAADPTAGLSAEEAARRLASVGPNRLADAPRTPMWRRFIDQFRSVLVGVLAAGAALAGLVGDLKDTIVIGTVLVINAVLGMVQEFRAERSLDALRAMLAPTARVRRNGQLLEIGADELVPGDIVLLEAGDRVPADARIALAADANTDESALTGESLPVDKSAQPVADAHAPLGDRTSMVWMNTTVTRGRIEAVVTATAMSTEMGRLAALLHSATETDTPLQQQLEGLGKRLALIAGGAMVVYATLGLARGDTLGGIASSAIALAVAAVPEGLPAVVTVTLALGVGSLARHGAIVKRLGSVETLGSTSVICSDKTGTLTMNAMSARDITLGGDRYEIESHGPLPLDDSRLTGPLFEALVLASDAAVDGDDAVGDPTEVGLVRLAARSGIDLADLRAARPRRAELPFDSTRKFMAVVVDGATDGAPGTLLLAKGAADVLIERCDAMATAEGPLPLDPLAADRIASMVEASGRLGRRVLAVASRRVEPSALVDADPAQIATACTTMTLLGLVGLADPPRPEAAEAIATARSAGVDVKMITGDHPVTATAIAAELGIVGRSVRGADLDAMSDAELVDSVEEIGVFARVSPEHKLRIVRALQARGRITAMTGDGVNDAPSLKQADVGVAMGITGTEVTKESADVVLADDQLGTIVRAIERGRAIYDNIVTFVRFQVATNTGAIFTLVGSQLAGLPKPMSAIQLLWVNIIMDGPPAMALGVDPPRTGVMDRPPRSPRRPILDGPTLRTLAVHGATMATVALSILAWAEPRHGRGVATTMAFTTFVLMQVVNALNVRSTRTVFTRDTLRNARLWLALGVVVALQVLAVEWSSLRTLFETADLDLAQWGIVVAGAAVLGVVDEARRRIQRPLGTARSATPSNR